MFSTDSFETSHIYETDMMNRVVRLACLNEKSKKGPFTGALVTLSARGYVAVDFYLCKFRGIKMSFCAL